jgi:hypothetical protein
MAGEPRIPCSACLARGEVELPAPHRETFARVGYAWMSTTAIWKRHGGRYPARTVLVNRLNALVRWGLVDWRWAGRGVEWRRI